MSRCRKIIRNIELSVRDAPLTMSKTMAGMQIARSGAPKSTELSLGESVGSNDSPGKPQAFEDIEALKIADVIVATAARISKTNEG